MLSKNKIWTIVAVVAIMFGAFGVRFYNFHDWLYFKMDQARDASMINNAVKNGAENLPLLGPRAGATQVSNGYLRLGPAYYYFQYLSGKIFDSTRPDVLAYPDLFFSIIILPLLFVFLRLYFARRHALMILAMYAFSFLIIQYSRFAWNPNPLPFFIILCFYALLRFLNAEKTKAKVGWISLWSVGLAVGSQLHFFGFFSLLGISGLLILVHYQVWKKTEILALFKKEALQRFAAYAGATVLFFGLLYTPIIISDIVKKGENSKNFIEALSTKAEKKPLLDKVVKAAEENGKYLCLLTTSECYQSSSKKNGWPIAATVVIIFAGLAIAAWKVWQYEAGLKRDFLWLFLIWIGVFFVLTIPVAFQLRPRFYIVVFAVPFIALGIVYQFLEEKYGKKLILFSLLVTGGILLSNARGTATWFAEQAQSQTKYFPIKRTLILKTKDGVTLGELQKAVDFMYAHHQPGATLYYYVKPEHVMPIRYLLYSKQNTDFNYSPMKINGDPQAEYFAVTPGENNLRPLIDKYGAETFEVVSAERAGQISVFQLRAKNRIVSDKFRFSRKSKNSDRVFWRDIFGGGEVDANDLEVVGDE